MSDDRINDLKKDIMLNFNPKTADIMGSPNMGVDFDKNVMKNTAKLQEGYKKTKQKNFDLFGL